MENSSAQSASAEGTKVKGASINARLEYVEESHGSRVLEQVLAILETKDKEQLGARILPSTMYPLELNGRLDAAIARVIQPANPVAVYRSLGRASAEKNLNSVHSIFLRSRGPHGILEHFPSVRRTYYSDGEATYEKIDDEKGVFRVRNAASHTLADCESTAGYFERAIELVGGTNVSVVLQQCRSRGNASCEFHCRWH